MEKKQTAKINNIKISQKMKLKRWNKKLLAKNGRQLTGRETLELLARVRT